MPADRASSPPALLGLLATLKVTVHDLGDATAWITGAGIGSYLTLKGWELDPGAASTPPVPWKRWARQGRGYVLVPVDPARDPHLLLAAVKVLAPELGVSPLIVIVDMVAASMVESGRVNKPDPPPATRGV